MTTDPHAMTNELAGPFCTCGDLSCATNRDASARCSNADDVSSDSRYPECWTEEDIAANELQWEIDTVLADNKRAARIAAEALA